MQGVRGNVFSALVRMPRHEEGYLRVQYQHGRTGLPYRTTPSSLASIRDIRAFNEGFNGAFTCVNT